MIRSMTLLATLALINAVTPAFGAGPRSDGSERLSTLEAPGASAPVTRDAHVAVILDRLSALEVVLSKTEPEGD